MTSLIISRVFIDPEECTAHTLCEPELSKGVITFEEYKSYETAVLTQERLPRTEQSLLSMLAAADVCPMAAFYIELENGKVMNVDDTYVQKKIKQGEVQWA